MNIVFIESAQNFGGARKAVIAMAQILQDSHNVRVVDFYGSCEPFVSACKKSAIPFDILHPNKNPHYIRSASTLRNKLSNIISFFPHLVKMSRRIREYVSEYNLDWICVSGFRPLIAMALNKPNAKVAFFAHGWYLNKDLSTFQKFLLKRVADRIVCISQATKHALYNEGVSSLQNLSVVHNVIDIDAIENVLPVQVVEGKHCPIILLAGGFVAGKGHHIAIEVAEELRNRGFDFRMILAGIIYQGTESQQYFEHITSLIQSKELSENISLVVNNHNVLGYMKGSDIIIHPSETEGFPLSVLEALSMGKIVIANAVGGITDMVVDGFTGILVEHNNIKQYADAIVRVLTNTEQYEKISRNAIGLVECCFQKDKIDEELMQVFR